MGIISTPFDGMVDEDLTCDSDEHLGFEPKVGTARERMVRNCSAQQVIPLPFVFDIANGRIQDGILILADHPDRPFRGEALLLWGITWQTHIHSLRSGHTEALCCNHVPVPGILYDCLGEPGETLDKIKFGKFVPNFYQRVDMPIATPAIRITLEISGPVTHAVLMGKGLQS